MCLAKESLLQKKASPPHATMASAGNRWALLPFYTAPTHALSSAANFQGGGGAWGVRGRKHAKITKKNQQMLEKKASDGEMFWNVSFRAFFLFFSPLFPFFRIGVGRRVGRLWMTIPILAAGVFLSVSIST